MKEIKRKPTEAETWERWVKEGDAQKAALLLDVPLEEVNLVIARRGEAAVAEVVGARFADLTLKSIETASLALWQLEPWRKVNAARDLLVALKKFFGVSEGKGNTNIGQIFIGTDRAESLKKTMETVEGEVVDDSNT